MKIIKQKLNEAKNSYLKSLLPPWLGFGRPAGVAAPQSDVDFLSSHRLKRSLETPPFAKPHQQVPLWGKIFITSLCLALAMPFAVAHAAAYVTLSSFSGTPTTVNVSGGGWNGGEIISIYLGSPSGSPTVTATADGVGFFGPVGVAIPPNSPEGSLSIFAVGSASHLTVSNSYFVVHFTPSLLASGSNSPGSTAQISGNGFAPGEPVKLLLNGTVGGIATADSSGSFVNASFTVPNVAVGTYQLHGVGQSSGADGIDYFYVGGFYPSAFPSTYYLLPGNSISFSGSGFGAGETVNVSLGSSSAPVSSLTVNSSGGFAGAGSFIIPLNSPAGIVSFTLKGVSTGVVAAPIMVTVGSFNSLATPSSYWILPGGTLNFSGSGYAAGETVQVFVDNNPTPVTSFVADSKGIFSNLGNIVVPFNFAGGSHTYRLHGTVSGTDSSVNITVGGFFPSIAPSAWWLLPGQQFTVDGSGFGPGETVKLTMGSVTVTATADSNGSFTAAGPFTVPFGGVASVTVTAIGTTSNASPAPLIISKGVLSPLVTPSAYYVSSGGAVSFTGSGFGPNEPISISNGSLVLTSAVADMSGNLPTTTVVTTFGPDRTEAYTFTGQNSGASAAVNITVAVLQPNVDADNYYVTPGSVVHVHGTGFAANEPIAITVGGNTVTATANANGVVQSTAITIPVTLSGSADIIMTGQTSGAFKDVVITLAPFQAQIAPSTYWALPGSPISFTGSGFASGEPVAVSLNNSSLGTATTTSAGGFSFGPVNLPYSSTGASFVFSPGISGGSQKINIALGSLSPGVWLSTYYDVGGAPLTVFGGGFGPNETVTVNFDGTILGTAVADVSGNFTLVSKVPFGPAGSKTIQARGNSSNVSSAPVSFTQPQIFVSAQLGSYAGAPGSSISFIGSGYLPNEPVTITTDRTGATAVYNLTADATGNFNDSGYHVPAAFTGGPLTLTITGTQSFTTKSIVYYVTGP